MDSIYITALLIGLAGGVHCVGMCGGIASSLLFSATPTVGRYQLLAAYNFGRIFRANGCVNSSCKYCPLILVANRAGNVPKPKQSMTKAPFVAVPEPIAHAKVE